jgi:hypothetical protein
MFSNLAIDPEPYLPYVASMLPARNNVELTAADVTVTGPGRRKILKVTYLDDG